MTRPPAPRALALLLLGAGVVLTVLPARADSRGGREAEAVALLTRAAQAAAARPWSGTQYVASWAGRTESAAVLDVVHEPGSGSTVSAAGDDDGTPTPELDPRLLRLLADSYALRVAGTARSAGRDAVLVEAAREEGAVAGRFWLDRASGLVLRREVYDADGARLRSSAFVELEVGAPVEVLPVGVLSPGAAPVGRKVDPDRAAGTWQPPRALPGGLALYDARLDDHDVLHLAYSDGLSTLSVFAQRGELDEAEPRAGFSAERLDGSRVWVADEAADRVVWEGDGHVFTLVSDASPETVRAAVRALPHAPAEDGGVLAAVGRGLARLGSWLNPFA